MNQSSTKTINSSISSQFFTWADSTTSFEDAQYDDLSILDAEILYDNAFKKREVFHGSNTKTKNQIIQDDYLIFGQDNETLNSRNDASKLSTLFVYRDYWTIKRYLMGNLQLRDLLFESYRKIVQFFGEDVRLSLELKTDIYEPEFQQLFIKVVSNKPFTESLKLLDRIENEWWFERTAYSTNSPVIILE